MKILVKPHTIDIQSNPVNELEINVTKCFFEFSEEITDEYVKEAYFTLGDGDTYKKIIVNDECDIPSEVLVKPGTIEVGVVAYLVEDEQTIKRYNPKPGYFTSWEGSLKEAENSQEITPSEMEQYEQALQEGLNQVENVDIDAEQTESGATVTITNRNAVEKTVTILNGQDGEKGADGKDGKDGKDGINGQDGITPTIGNNGNWYLGDTDTGKPSRGIQGETGPAGADGRDGIDGQNGTNGVDGYSPTATVTKSGNTATITITDKNGTTTTTVSDGTNGTNGQNGVGVPTGGTQGQILAKATGTDYDTEWINAPSTNKIICDFTSPVAWNYTSTYTVQSSNFTTTQAEQLGAIVGTGLSNVIIRIKFNESPNFLATLSKKATSSSLDTYTFLGQYENVVTIKDIDVLLML